MTLRALPHIEHRRNTGARWAISVLQSKSRRIRTQWKCWVSLPKKVEVLDELAASEEALRFGWASWAIHRFFKKLTDCGDASEIYVVDESGIRTHDSHPTNHKAKTRRHNQLAF